MKFEACYYASWLNKLLEELTIMPHLTPWARVNQTGMVSTGEGSVFRPFQNLRCCHESPRPSGRYRNAGRVSKQILILHEDLVLKSGTVQKYKILLTSWLASYSLSRGAQYVTMDNKPKCPSLASSFLATPPIKM